MDLDRQTKRESRQEIHLPTKCSHCGASELFVRRGGESSSGRLLRGLGELFAYAEFDVVVCASCGHTLLFAEPTARKKLKEHADWKRLS